MNREIKFRAWDKENQTMYNWRTIMQYPLAYTFCSDIIVPMQYTGLKDKNGVEIYEGDILLHSFYSNYIQESLFSKQVVQWHEDCCGFGLVLKILAKSKKIEVIGNIYDNPELIKGVE